MWVPPFRHPAYTHAVRGANTVRSGSPVAPVASRGLRGAVHEGDVDDEEVSRAGRIADLAVDPCVEDHPQPPARVGEELLTAGTLCGRVRGEPRIRRCFRARPERRRA